jgi:hypothetical protein
MDSTEISGTFSQNGWTIYLVALLVLSALFFVQKYAYLIDRKLNQLSRSGSVWEGKPWPLLAALLLGLITYLYNVFSPNDMQQNPSNWGWPEWILLFFFGVMLGILSFESFSHFGKRMGLIRILIFVLLSAAFYVAGMLTGLLLVTVLALGILIYFINFWRKRISIK